MKSEKELQTVLNSILHEITGKQIDGDIDKVAIERLKLALSTIAEIDFTTRAQIIKGLSETEPTTLVITEEDRRRRKKFIKEWFDKLDEIQRQLDESIMQAYHKVQKWK